MGKTNKTTYLAYSGHCFDIEFYQRESGEIMAEDWLELMPLNIQQKFAALFAWMGDHGRITNEQNLSTSVAPIKSLNLKQIMGESYASSLLAKESF